jgi:hypothetical protein
MCCCGAVLPNDWPRSTEAVAIAVARAQVLGYRWVLQPNGTCLFGNGSVNWAQGILEHQKVGTASMNRILPMCSSYTDVGTAK